MQNNETQTLDGLIQISAPYSTVVMGKNGKPQEVSMRVPVNGEIAVIDALNLVMHPDTFDTHLHQNLTNPDIDDDKKRKYATETAYHIGNVLRHIMGDDFADIHDTGVSRNRYHYTFRIGDTVAPLGLIGIHNFNTDNPSILIMIYGEGTHVAETWWEFGLYQWLIAKDPDGKPRVIDPKISRCDLAHDDIDGLYSSAELANEADTNGGFALTNKLPQVQHLGDWKRHEGRGRTLQVGARANGKLYRGYEKGKQLGDTESFWFRHEVELGNKSRIIPLEILLRPSEYFAGTYPYMSEIAHLAGVNDNFCPTRIETIKKTMSISFQKSVSVVKRQFGRYLKVFRDIYNDDSEILEMLETEKTDYYPKRLKLFEKMIFRAPHWTPFGAPMLESDPYQNVLKESIYAI